MEGENRSGNIPLLLTKVIESYAFRQHLRPTEVCSRNIVGQQENLLSRDLSPVTQAIEMFSLSEGLWQSQTRTCRMDHPD